MRFTQETTKLGKTDINYIADSVACYVILFIELDDKHDDLPSFRLVDLPVFGSNRDFAVSAAANSEAQQRPVSHLHQSPQAGISHLRGTKGTEESVGKHLLDVDTLWE